MVIQRTHQYETNIHHKNNLIDDHQIALISSYCSYPSIMMVLLLLLLSLVLVVTLGLVLPTNGFVVSVSHHHCSSTTTTTMQMMLDPSSMTTTAATVVDTTMPTIDSNSNMLLLSNFEAFWQTSPYTAAALICGFKASAADMIAQQSQQQQQQQQQVQNEEVSELSVDLHNNDNNSHNNKYDMKRNFAFVLYGALYQGMAHEFIFNTLYPSWFGSGVELPVVLTKVAFNLCVQTTLVTLPVAYLCKAIIMNDTTNHATDNNKQQDTDHNWKPAVHIVTPSNNNPQHRNNDDTNTNDNPVSVALSKYWQDVQTQGLLWKCFALWGPVHCLTFSVIPEHLRVTFIAFISFFWLIALSHISSTPATKNGT